MAGANRPECVFFVPDNTERDRGTVFFASLRVAKSTLNNEVMCVHVASMISAVVPELKGTLVRTLEQRGIVVKEVSLPSSSSVNIDIDRSIDYPSMLVLFGCFVILLYKNLNLLNPLNYSDFMANRIREMFSEVGCDPATPLVFSFAIDKAEAIRAILGSSFALKEAIVRLVAEVNFNRNVGLFLLCPYLLLNLSMYEVEIFSVIDETMFQCKSPVLKDPRIIREALNLYEAFEIICRSDWAQFCRYLGNKYEKRKLEYSRFSTIIAVAEELKKDSNSSTIANPLVRELVQIHKNAMAAQINGDSSLRSNRI